MNGLRDFVIFILLLALAWYIWTNKQPTEHGKATEPVKVEEETPQQKVSDKQFLLTYTYDMRFPDLETLEKAVLTIPVPQNSNSRQGISELCFSHKNPQIVKSDDSKFAKITLTNFAAQRTEVKMTMKANLHIYDYKRAVELKQNYDRLDNKKRYLLPEKNIEVDSVTVKAAANNIKGQTPIEVLSSIVSYMQNNIEFGRVVSTIGAEKALKNHLAGTSDYANTFVALARAKGIPARVVSGYRIMGITARRHAWAEVYFQQYGWVTFDPHNSPVDITDLNAYYIVSAYNSFTADSLETFYKGTSRSGKVISDVDVKEL